MCTSCEAGKYIDERGGSECKSCEVAITGTTTMPEIVGAASTDECVCRPGFYLDLYDRSLCQTVKKGVEADEYGLTLQELPLSPGYWRGYINSTAVRSCRTEEACVGSRNVGEYCKEGHNGPYCELCDPMYSKDVFGVCQKCDVSTTNVLGTFSVFLGSFLGLGCTRWLYKRFMKKSKKTEEKIKSFKVALRIIFVCYQILGVLPSIIPNMELPKEFEDFLESMQFFQLNFFSLVSAGCLYDGFNYHNLLLMTTASPLAICGLMVFIGMSNKNWKDTAFTLALATTYVVVSEREPRASNTN